MEILAFVLLGGLKSLGDILIVRTSRFFAAPENKGRRFVRFVNYFKRLH